MCAPYYVEFPVDNVIDVHWKKKDKPPDDFPLDSPPCGGVYGRASGYARGIIITEYTIFDLFRPPPPPGQPTGPGNPDIPWYLWNTPAGGFTVEIRPEIQYVYGRQSPVLPEGTQQCNEYSLTIGLHLIRNRDPHLVAQTPIDDYPAGGQVIQFQGIQRDESWYPIVLVVGNAVDTPLNVHGPCVGKGANALVPILIQAHCDHETYGGPPPQQGLPPD